MFYFYMRNQYVLYYTFKDVAVLLCISKRFKIPYLLLRRYCAAQQLICYSYSIKKGTIIYDIQFKQMCIISLTWYNNIIL